MINPAVIEKMSASTPAAVTSWSKSVAEDKSRCSKMSSSDLNVPRLADFWNTGSSADGFNQLRSSPQWTNGASDLNAVIDNGQLQPLQTFQSESVEASQFTQMVATLHMLAEASNNKQSSVNAQGQPEWQNTFSPFSESSWPADDMNNKCSDDCISRGNCYSETAGEENSPSSRLFSNCPHYCQYNFNEIGPMSPNDDFQKTPIHFSQTSPPILTSSILQFGAATIKSSTPPSPLSSTASSTSTSCFENAIPYYPSFPYFNAILSQSIEQSTTLTNNQLDKPSPYELCNAPQMTSSGFVYEPARACCSSVSLSPMAERRVNQSMQPVEHSTFSSAGGCNQLKNQSTFGSHQSSNTAAFYPAVTDTEFQQPHVPDEVSDEPRLKLKLTRRNGRSNPTDSVGPTYWGMWEDERSRMVYVSWLPRCARASDRSEKKRCELVLKDFIQFVLGFHGLEKVLLFPPNSAHCKLLFVSESAARTFLSVFGGIEAGPGPTLWKILVCRNFQVDIRDGIYSTRVHIIWADQTKNEAEGWGVRLSLAAPNGAIQPSLHCGTIRNDSLAQ